ncbi:response regulator [candidate division KSB1 bacterium]|nr:response regulator [candidate division KSB1 bacterium]
MKQIAKLLALIVLVVYNSTSLGAIDVSNLKFKHYGTADGLSNSIVTDIQQDAEGFVWIATTNGLNKFNGYNFQIYRRSHRDTTSILHNYINILYYSLCSELWIGTQDGISKYNPKNDNFTNYIRQADDSGHLSDIRGFFENRNGTLFVINDRGVLYTLNRDNQVFKFVVDLKIHVEYILQDENENLWIGGKDGLFVYSFQEHKLSPYIPDSGWKNYSITTLMENDKAIWVGTRENGIFIIDKTSLKFQSVKSSTGYIKTIFQDKDSHVWVSDIDRLRIYNQQDLSFQQYVHDIRNESSLSGIAINTIYQDRQENIWLGMNFGGISLTKNQQSFKHIKYTPPEKTDAISGTVSAITGDHDGNLWIGYYSGGINVVNRKNGTVKYFAPGDGNKDLKRGSVFEIFCDSDGEIWVGSYDGGLQRFIKSENRFKNYEPSPRNKKSIPGYDVRSITEDQNGNLWIVTHGTGISRFNKEDETFITYKSIHDDPHAMASEWGFHIYATSDGSIWIATVAGLSRLDNENSFTSYFFDPNDSASISNNYIITLYEDSRHNVWIGTSDGLNKYDRQRDAFVHYYKNNGIISNYICALLEDNNDNLWISTKEGLSRLNLNTQHFKNFDLDDGLDIAEFFENSCFKSKAGELLFGGVNGIIQFNPDSIRSNTEPPAVYLSDFLLLNKSVPITNDNAQSVLPQHIRFTQQLKLSHNQKMLSFKWVALNFINPEKNEYAYRMEGFDKNWNYVGAKREATYTNINPGTYTFNVKASNNDGIWNETGAAIKIVITPPYWATWWFRSIIIFVLLISFFIAHLLRMYTVKQHNKHLEKIIERRTQQLANEKNVLQTVIDMVPDSIYMKDKENKFLLNNLTHIRSLGMKDQHDLVGKTDMDFFPPEFVNEFHHDEKRIMETGQAILNKDEKAIDPISRLENWVSTSKVRILDSHGNVQGIVGISRNINERKRFEAKLKKAKLDAEAASQSKSEFLANMSHEIRTPMNGIIGMTELALDLAPNKQQRDYLNIAKRSAESLLDLLNDILDFSKIEAGKLELEEVDFNLRNVIETALTTFAIQAHTKGVELLCDIKNDVPVSVRGDSGRLRQIIVNLVGNALKFTEKGEIIVRVDFDSFFKASNPDQIGLHFSVSDTGIGIPADKLDKIFESFSQADVSTTRKYGGTGLGLTISQKLSELMGGRIWVESEVGKGSVFQFTGIFHPGSDEESPVYRNWFHEMEAPRVLIVDDNNTNCIILRDVLISWGFDPVIAMGGSQALNKMSDDSDNKKLFSLILLDLKMPEMDGFEIAEKIRANHAWDDVKIVMMSSINEKGYLERSKNIGINNYLQKPVRQDDLIQTILLTLGKVDEVDGYEAAEGSSKVENPSLKILLAEDNIINQKVAINFLKKWGHQVTVANDGKEAIEILKQKQFDLILMDVQMPNMDGVEATRIIRKSDEFLSNSGIPIIAMTAHAMKDDKESFLNAGMDDYISKPIDINEVMQMLKKYVPVAMRNV